MLDASYVSRILNDGKAPKLFDPVKLSRINKPKLLDLFCGAGGSARGFQNMGFYVVGVDIKWQPNYCGNQFVQADAIKWLKDNIEFVIEIFDVINASPPCQAYSLIVQDRDVHPRHIDVIRELMLQTDLPYIIENVEGYNTGLQNPTILCGSSFDLRVRRHRLFETSFHVVPTECKHEWQDDDPRYLIYDHKKWLWRGWVPVYGTGSGKGYEYWPMAMGCGNTWNECWMTRYELTQAIPPTYTEYIAQFIPIHARLGHTQNLIQV